MNPIADVIIFIHYLIALYLVIFWALVFLEQTEPHRPRKLRKHPLVSVLIPALNEEETIAWTLDSLLNLKYPPQKLEIIVINDGSTDRTAEVVEAYQKKHSHRAITLINQKNKGKAQALNTGLQHAHGEYFACLDADSAAAPLTLRNMLLEFENGPSDLTIVTPNMKIEKPTTLWQKLQRIEYIFGMFIASLMSAVDCLYVAPGPFSLYKTAPLRKIGGFMSHITEDQEIAYRAQKNQLKIKQCPDGYVYTKGPATLKGLYHQRNRWFKGGLDCAVRYRSLLLNKNYGDFGMIQMSVNVVAFFLAIISIAFTGYYVFWPLATGFYDLYLVGFDIMPYLRTFELHFSLLAVDFEKLFILLTTFFFTLTLFVAAHRKAGENMFHHGGLMLMPYFFVYYLILSFIAVVVAAEYSLGIQQKW